MHADRLQSGRGREPCCCLPSLTLTVNKSLSIDLASGGVTSVLLHPGYVRTDMTGWHGLIDTQTCVKGELDWKESCRPERSGWGTHST